MNIRLIIILLTTLLSLSVPAVAHDPSQQKNGEQPNCEALKTMDVTNMDANDPIMQAIMKQCGEHHNHDNKNDDQHEKSSDRSTDKNK